MMKRVSNGPDLEYHNALKKVNLVDRNPTPNGVALVSAARTGKHTAGDIVELASQIKHADSAIKDTATGKLGLILEQIRFLQSQAEQILRETEESENLHHAACNFRKIPGNIYHLYKKEGGQAYFSMLSPEEWGSSNTQQYLGSYRLETDSTWTPIEKLEQKKADKEWAERLLKLKNRGGQNLLSIECASIEEDRDTNGK